MVITACGGPMIQYHVANFDTGPNNFGDAPDMDKPLGSMECHIHFQERKIRIR